MDLFFLCANLSIHPCNEAFHQDPLLLTAINFNPSMDK